MATPKFTLYKHVKLDYGWRYCKAAWHTNGKVKPNIVLVKGIEETHREGAYYLSHNNAWIPVGDDALNASKERLKRLNTAEYHRLHGTTDPSQEKALQPVGITLQMATDAYLEGIAGRVASRNRRKGTLQLAKTTLKKFSAHAKVEYLSEIKVAHLDNYAAWCITTGRTHSPQTGRNEFLRVNQFLKSCGIVLTKRDGDKLVPVGMKDAPKVPQRTGVITNSSEELEKFFAACVGFKQSLAFQIFQRAGLREMELATLRPEDNNVSEREMKRVVFNRKNSLFVGNPRGGRTAAILASPTSTCRKHDVDPQLYLTRLLANLSQVRKSELPNWLPDRWKQLLAARLSSWHPHFA
jgi:hypothetical protein